MAKMRVWFDEEGDFLEVTFGKPVPSRVEGLRAG